MRNKKVIASQINLSVSFRLNVDKQQEEFPIADGLNNEE
jgi:hypothetical protein